MKPLLFSGAVLSLLGVASAQQVDVLPAGSKSTNTRTYEYMLNRGGSTLPLHYQHIYNSSEFTKSAGVLLQFAFRRNNFYSNSVPAGSTTCTITIGYSTNDAANASTTFANNLAVNPKEFFKGTVNYPAAPKGTGPAPFTHVVKPATPFVFLPSAGKSVCVDHVITASSYGNSTITMDSIEPDSGARNSNPSAQSSCKFSNGKYNNSIGYTTGGLTPAGGTWYVQYYSLLPNAPGIATLSAFGVKNPGPWPLPINLTPLGAPGCTWNVGLEMGLWVPLTADANGRARWPNVTIPAGLGGVSFYDHALFLDKAANAGGLVVTWPSEWYIGTGKGPRGATVYKRSDTGGSATGSKLRNEEVIICEFTY